MFRKADLGDLDKISAIYNEIHTAEEAGETKIGWVRSIYPTRATAKESIAAGDMFVEEVEGQIVAAGRINQIQVPEYSDAAWNFKALDEEVMVLHTLVVSPQMGGHGFGTSFVDFYEKYALDHGCRYLRMDTNERNQTARKLYKKLGYTEVSIVPCKFNGIDGVQLICLEKAID